MSLRLFVSICLMCVLLPLAAQEHITGKISDRETGESLGFTQVRWKKGGLGTLSNESGMFSIPRSEVAGDTLRISYIGYQVAQIPAGMISSSEVEIQLTPATLTLDEVLITPTDALDLVRQAIAAWPGNRRSGAVNFQGFFRELLAEDGRYVQLNEAVTRYHLTGDEANTVQVELLRARTLKDSSDFKSIHINMGTGKIHQMVNKSPVDEKMAEDFLDERHFKLYEYVLDTILYRDGRPTYVVSVDQDRKLRKKLYKATVLIDVKTMAFAGISFGLSPRGKQFRLSQLGVSASVPMQALKLLGYDFSVERHEGRQEYMYHEGAWLPSYLREEVLIYAKEPAFSGGHSGTTSGVRELAITRVSAPQAIPAARQFTADEEFTEAASSYEDSYWADFPYLAPNESLRKIAKGLIP